LAGGEDTLRTERLLLEPWHERHRAALRAMSSDPRVMRFVSFGELWETEKADESFDRILAHWRDHGFGWRAVLERTSREWLGFVGLNYVRPDVQELAPGEVEIGWWIIPSAWGRGYATEGAAAARDEGFLRAGLDHFVARLLRENMASARVAQKIGMRFEDERDGRYGETVYKIDIYRLDRTARSAGVSYEAIAPGT
jgi:RimJ/RimL family protein N-acetyltransferase